MSNSEIRIRKIKTSKDGVELLNRVYEVLRHAHDAAESMLLAYLNSSMNDEAKQDLLRAMLILACSGLDATVKELIKVAVPELFYMDESVQEEIRKYIERRLKEDLTNRPSKAASFLSRIFVSEFLHNQLIDEYTEYLTGGSLQSSEELSRARRALGLHWNDEGDKFSKLKIIFKVRNQIVHELDIETVSGESRRRLRKQGDMVEYTNLILEVAERIYEETYSKLRSYQQNQIDEYKEQLE